MKLFLIFHHLKCYPNFLTHSKLISILSAIIILVVNPGVVAQQLSLKQVTFSDSTHDGYPAWSPDGKYIIYSAGTRDHAFTLKIPADGGTPEVVTEVFAHHATWSPDGAYIAFDGYMGSMIQLIAAQGGVPIRINPESIPVLHSGYPNWSPDGSMISFMSKGDVWIFNLEKGIFSNIFQLEGKLVLPFDWSPEGENILVDIRDTLKRGETDIWMIPVKQGEAIQITDFDGYQVKPDMSPDGSMILFTSSHGGNVDLWIISPDGGKPVQLTFYEGDDDNPGYDLEASWSPDGKKIAFSSTRSGSWAIWVMEPDLEYIRSGLKIKD